MMGTTTYVFVNLDHVTHVTEGLKDGSVLHFSGEGKETLKVRETPEIITEIGKTASARTASLAAG